MRVIAIIANTLQSFKRTDAMIIRTIWMQKKNFWLMSLLLALVACGDDSGGDSGKEEPNLLVVGDYVMTQCTVYYQFVGGWSECRDAAEWSSTPNQPVFTALNDCLVAKGQKQDLDATVWDDTQEDRDRGWAVLLICAPVVEG